MYSQTYTQPSTQFPCLHLLYQKMILLSSGTKLVLTIVMGIPHVYRYSL